MNLFALSLRAAAAAAAVIVLASCATAQAAPDPSAKAPRFVRWVALGDSITSHGPAEKLGWLGVSRGMAASTLENDYVHLLQKKIQEKEPGSVTQLAITGGFGKLGSGTPEEIGKRAVAVAAGQPDLVTIQTGENDHFKDIGADGYEARYRAMIDGLLSGAKKPVIVCTGVWQPGGALDPADPKRYAPGSESRAKDDIVRAICAQKKLIFVPIADAAAVPANRGAGEHNGVRWHPNDAGMKAYADAIFAVLYGQ